ncbi:hypothetical protein [Streptomyces sp. NPDC057375]|uniref:hypothetical protein n=1 Tax=Streptomyces sp. NPDC057375 TaxID=3346109 RepID=UPI00363514A2
MLYLIGRLDTWVTLPLKPRGTHRSPYGPPTTLDGTQTVPVRPYLLLGTLYAREAAA